MKTRALLAVSLLVVATGALAGGSAGFADLLTQAQVAWGKRDAATAVHKLEDALALARAQAPLEIRAALAVDEMMGLGVYQPAKDGVLTDRRLQLYVEVANLGGEEMPDGAHRVRLELEGTFSLEDGAERKGLGKKTLGAQVYETRANVGVAWLGTAIQLGDDFAPGTYHVEVKVKDLVSSKSATRDVTFVVR